MHATSELNLFYNYLDVIPLIGDIESITHYRADQILLQNDEDNFFL